MSEELESRLRRDLAALDDVGVASHSQLYAAGARLEARRSARRQTAVATSCAVLLLVGVGAIWWTNTRPIDQTAAEQSLTTPPSSVPGTSSVANSAPATTIPTTTAVAQPSSVAELSGAWRPIEADPNGNANVVGAVWTGTEAIVLTSLDGVAGIEQIRVSAYEPNSGTWRPLASPPLDGLLWPFPIWTGDEMLLVASGFEQPGQGGARVDRSQAYDPDTDSWRPIAAPPYPPLPVGAGTPSAWTGDELLVLAYGEDAEGEAKASPLAYSPATDSWRQLAAPPIAVRSEAASVWTGTEWIVWGGEGGSVAYSDGAAYNPATDSWRTIADSPLSPRKVHAVWTGTEMIVDAGWSGDATPMAYGDGAAYDPLTDSWRTIAPGPAHPGFQPLFTGKHLLMFAKGGVSVYDVAADVWVDTCCATGGASGPAVWTGAEALVFAGSNTGARFTPPV